MTGADLLTERLLRVIDEGRRTATYMLALLLALIDAAALAPGESRVPTRDLAALVLETYYPQTRLSKVCSDSGPSRVRKPSRTLADHARRS